MIDDVIGKIESEEVKKYISSNIEVEAIQWTGRNLEDLKDFCKNEEGESILQCIFRTGMSCFGADDYISITLKSKRCDVCVTRGDFLVKIFGDIIPMSAEEFFKNFQKSYETCMEEFSW